MKNLTYFKKTSPRKTIFLWTFILFFSLIISCKKSPPCYNHVYPALSLYQREYFKVENLAPKFKITIINEFGFPKQLDNANGKYNERYIPEKEGGDCYTDVFETGRLELSLNKGWINVFFEISNRGIADTSKIGINYFYKSERYLDSLEVNKKMYYDVFLVNNYRQSFNGFKYGYFVKGIGFIYIEYYNYKIELIP